MRRFRVALVLEALAGAALVVALLGRYPLSSTHEIAYVPLRDDGRIRLDAFQFMSALDARLWLASRSAASSPGRSS